MRLIGPGISGSSGIVPEMRGIPLEEFQEYLERIWDSRKLTNKGKYHDLFEEKLAEYLNVKYVSLFSNGTLALISALQCLRITGEVITLSGGYQLV